MKLRVSVKTQAKMNRVEKISGTEFRVWVAAPPKEGRANEALIELLSDYLKVPKRSCAIVSGLRSKRKVVEVKTG